MVQYEKNMKKKIQSIIYDGSRRAILNEVSLLHCEQKRKLTEDKLNNLHAKMAALLQKLVSDEILLVGVCSGERPFANQLCVTVTKYL